MRKKHKQRKRSCSTYVQYGDCGGPEPLTVNQVKKLCPQRLLGCGSFACAYTSGRRKGSVVKFTMDPSDVAAFIAFKDKRVAKLRGAYKVGENDYAIVTEKLRQLSNRDKETLWLDKMRDTRDTLDTRSRRRGPTKKFSNGERMTFVRQCKSNACRKFGNELLDLHERAAKKKINLFDFHAGNFGKDKRGNWKMLDLGVSGKEPKHVPVLNGLKKLTS